MLPCRCLAVCLACGIVAPSYALDFEQIISREHPAFRCENSRLNVGRDGNLYWVSGGSESYLLRTKADGTEPLGGPVVYAARGCAANRDGITATANAHFAHAVNFYDARFNRVGTANEFLVSDQVGYGAPSSVEAGASGDFYACDPYRDRILRLGPSGKVLRGYSFPRDPALKQRPIDEFRVCEKTESFVLLRVTGPLICQGFDGQVRWTLATSLYSGDGSLRGGFDLDDSGNLYVIEPKSDVVQVFDAAGKPLREIKLDGQKERPKPDERNWSDLRVDDGKLYLRRRHATELARVFSTETGEMQPVIEARHQRLTVTIPDRVWQAGGEVPFSAALTGDEGIAAPRFRVWARPFGELEYRELTPAGGKLRVPSDWSGVYLLKVTPEVVPWQREERSDYGIWTWIEVRRKDAKGSISVWAEHNRTAFARGEAIRCFTALKGEPKTLAGKLQLHDDERLVAEEKIEIDRTRPKTVEIPSSLTSALKPGRYRLSVEAEGVTSVPLTIRIGPGGNPDFLQIQYGDYGFTYPPMNLWDGVDRTAASAERFSRIGINAVVDRLGLHPTNLRLDGQPLAEGNAILKQIETDPLSPSPERYRLPSSPLQMQSHYSAAGVKQMAILMGNDAGLPLGTGFDNRKPPKLLDDLTTVTEALKPYPSFRGWVWASNWWNFDRRQWNGGRTPEEIQSCEAAYKVAREKGVWNPILDTVSDVRFGFAADAQAMFNRKLKEIAPGLTTASAGPHRNVESYPPVSLGNVDEVDLQAQWEQILIPYSVMHGVDFYTRPGKKSWTHPEIWNDFGTGDLILPNLFTAVMRGVNGVGNAGPIPPWTQHRNPLPDDPRGGQYGVTSVYRAMHSLLKRYGPWLNTLENDDRVAIVVSGRMLRIDDWPRTYGTHFGRLFEAYMTCMFAHHPAGYVFVEDLKPGLLKKYKAVLVVGQRVELEPQLERALREAQEAGVSVFHDGTCREEWVQGFTPLGIRFNQFEKDPSPAADDHAFWRFPKYCLKTAGILKSMLDPVVSPPVEIDNPEVFVSVRRNGDTRYVFLVNQTTPEIPPGKLWRVNLECANRRPVVAKVKLAPELLKNGVVLDLFSGKYFVPNNGEVEVDLRTTPFAILGILPHAIPEKMTLSLPKRIVAGRELDWSARFTDSSGIPTQLPIRLRLIDGTSEPIEERHGLLVNGWIGSKVTIPVNASGKHELEVEEYFTHRRYAVAFEVEPATLPQPLVNYSIPQNPAEPGLSGTEVSARKGVPPDLFGPHFRCVSVSPDGKHALFPAMNWDHNLYSMNVATSEVTPRGKVGDYFAFGSIALKRGFAIQGFDFDSAEGYHLYLLDENGKPERRFALYGLPHRQIHRFVPNLFKDHQNSFAVPEAGSWVASGGNLGIAVWSRDGKLHWSKPHTGEAGQDARLLALDERTFVTARGMKVTALDPLTGHVHWNLNLAETGEVRDWKRSDDGKTLGVLATTEGGRVFLIRDGKLTRTHHARGMSLALAPDGSAFATVEGGQLRYYTAARGFSWSFQGDDFLHDLSFSPDGKRLVMGSSLGTLTVLDLDGKTLFERDLGAWPHPAWLPSGELLAATWMGKVFRFDRAYQHTSVTKAAPERVVKRSDAIRADSVPTTKIDDWANSLPSPLPLGKNLLDPANVHIRFREEGGHAQFKIPPGKLVDGDLQPPAIPWLDWSHLNGFAETFRPTEIVLDTFRTQLRLDAVTFVEDPSHPETWVREATLEYWNPTAEKWVRAERFLSDSATHSHQLTKPVEASRFRLVLPPGLCGNLRLAEIVFHGAKLGSNHPDVMAQKPVAVLFDEQEDFRNPLSGGHQYRFEGAFSGGRCLELARDQNCSPAFVQPFGHCLPGWDFEVVEKPGPGQYRYAQFAWKAGGPQTKGMAVRIGGNAHHLKAELFAGSTTPFDGGKRVKIADAPPSEWKTVRVDLWNLLQAPTRIQSVEFRTTGGPMLFDQLLLGRTEADLPPLTE